MHNLESIFVPDLGFFLAGIRLKDELPGSVEPHPLNNGNFAWVVCFLVCAIEISLVTDLVRGPRCIG